MAYILNFQTEEELTLSIKKVEQEEVLAERLLTFKEVEPEELTRLRLSKIPGMAYKKDEKLYYAEMPFDDVRIFCQNSNVPYHLCGQNCKNVCDGCPRTFDLTVGYHVRNRKSFKRAVKDSWRIEKYEFLKEGIEVFNMKAPFDAQVVLGCSEYEEKIEGEKKKLTSELKVGLAQFYWDDFKGSRKEMIERIKSNLIKANDDSYYGI